MAKAYIKLFFDWEKKAEALNEEEKLNLIRAMIAYASGSEYEFIGNDRFVFPVFKVQLDKDGESYERQCKANQENGKQSKGRPRKNAVKPNETEKTQNNPMGFEKPNKPTETEKTLRIKNEEERIKNEESRIKNQELSLYDDERPNLNTIEAYLSNVLINISSTCMQELQAFKEIFPDDVIKHAIDRALDRSKASWAYIKTILNGYQSQGVKTLAQAIEADRQYDQSKQKNGYNKPPQQKHNYQQHEYTDDMFGKDFFYDLDHDHM